MKFLKKFFSLVATAVMCAPLCLAAREIPQDLRQGLEQFGRDYIDDIGPFLRSNYDCIEDFVIKLREDIIDFLSQISTPRERIETFFEMLNISVSVSPLCERENKLEWLKCYRYSYEYCDSYTDVTWSDDKSVIGCLFLTWSPSFSFGDCPYLEYNYFYEFGALTHDFKQHLKNSERYTNENVQSEFFYYTPTDDISI